jgi:hypothetical protein
MRLPTQSVGAIRSASATPVGAGVLPAQALSSIQGLARGSTFICCYPCGSHINGGVMWCCEPCSSLPWSS